MKKAFLFLLAAILLASCDNSEKKQSAIALAKSYLNAPYDEDTIKAYYPTNDFIADLPYDSETMEVLKGAKVSDFVTFDENAVEEKGDTLVVKGSFKKDSLNFDMLLYVVEQQDGKQMVCESRGLLTPYLFEHQALYAKKTGIMDDNTTDREFAKRLNILDDMWKDRMNKLYKQELTFTINPVTSHDTGVAYDCIENHTRTNFKNVRIRCNVTGKNFRSEEREVEELPAGGKAEFVKPHLSYLYNTYNRSISRMLDQVEYEVMQLSDADILQYIKQCSFTGQEFKNRLDGDTMAF